VLMSLAIQCNRMGEISLCEKGQWYILRPYA
jgi:hypothetical protein